MSQNYANLYTDENSQGLQGTKIISFPWPAKRISITNYSSNQELKWRFKAGHPWATLDPLETVAMDVSVKQLTLESVGATYKMWALG